MRGSSASFVWSWCPLDSASDPSALFRKAVTELVKERMTASQFQSAWSFFDLDTNQSLLAKDARVHACV